MRGRGRPRHPETLTPRQQQVFAMLREGLTNDQIADRLGIGVDGAKYHVAEVLHRLGLRNRYEAQLVQAEAGRRRWAPGIFGLPLLRRVRPNALAYAAAAGSVVVAAAGIVVLAVAVMSTNGDAGAGIEDGDVAARLASRELVAVKTGSDVWHISVYDSVAAKQVAAFDAGTGGERPQAAVIAGDRIVVDYGARLVSYRIDGSDERTLMTLGSGLLTSVASSRDGSKLAVTIATRDTPCPVVTGDATPCGQTLADITEIAVIDTASGRELLHMAQSDPKFARLTGHATFPVWRDDGEAFVVRGMTEGEQPGTYAVVHLDGTVMIDGRTDYVVPTTGRYIATGSIEPCPNLNLRRHELRIVGVETGATATRVTDPKRVFFPYAFSPDGNELLYFSEAYPGGPDDASCQWDASTVVWSVMSLDAPDQDGVDPDQVQRRWYGAGAVTFGCAAQDAYPGGHCLSPISATKALVGGKTIASGADIRVLSDTYDY